MLWIEKYRPESLDDVILHPHIREVLQSCAASHSFPHLLVSGPRGAGKTTALYAFTKAVYGEHAALNVTEIPSDTLFFQGRAYLEGNSKFTHLYQKNQSVLSNVKYIVQWHASLRPLNADFRVIIFDEADALPHDAQQALRRTMERFSATCRFVFVTTRPAALIAPLRSRSLPLTFLPVAADLIGERLREILALEGKTDAVASDDIDLLALSVQGDLRKAIMHLQVAVETQTPVDPEALDESETGKIAVAALNAAREGDLAAARKAAEGLMIEYGFSGRELLTALHKIVKSSSYRPDIALHLAKTDEMLIASGNEYLQINAFLAEIAEMDL
ncbi:MAG: AAA family ATPase [Methanocalculus sp. MSAO_Arc2]|uniref:AAA family ATPase n=1 Tax=Methanocalculus sp. MSAO_Arc2 TaxID=2293855 RepID=UPI000FF254E7|nr:MAG: AAA family ATPase [Methanocalculus sp. MSAO_Arc2]